MLESVRHLFTGIPSDLLLSVGIQTQWARGYVKERLELIPMGSINIGQGGVNSRPGSHGIPDGMQTDEPGFSLCAAPLESFGPGF